MKQQNTVKNDKEFAALVVEIYAEHTAMISSKTNEQTNINLDMQQNESLRRNLLELSIVQAHEMFVDRQRNGLVNHPYFPTYLTDAIKAHNDQAKKSGQGLKVLLTNINDENTTISAEEIKLANNAAQSLIYNIGVWSQKRLPSDYPVNNLLQSISGRFKEQGIKSYFNDTTHGTINMAKAGTRNQQPNYHVTITGKLNKLMAKASEISAPATNNIQDDFGPFRTSGQDDGSLDTPAVTEKDLIDFDENTPVNKPTGGQPGMVSGKKKQAEPKAETNPVSFDKKAANASGNHIYTISLNEKTVIIKQDGNPFKKYKLDPDKHKAVEITGGNTTTTIFLDGEGNVMKDVYNHHTRFSETTAFKEGETLTFDEGKDGKYNRKVISLNVQTIDEPQQSDERYSFDLHTTEDGKKEILVKDKNSEATIGTYKLNAEHNGILVENNKLRRYIYLDNNGTLQSVNANQNEQSLTAIPIPVTKDFFLQKPSNGEYKITSVHVDISRYEQKAAEPIRKTLSKMLQGAINKPQTKRVVNNGITTTNTTTSVTDNTTQAAKANLKKYQYSFKLDSKKENIIVKEGTSNTEHPFKLGGQQNHDCVILKENSDQPMCILVEGNKLMSYIKNGQDNHFEFDQEITEDNWIMFENGDKMRPANFNKENIIITKKGQSASITSGVPQSTKGAAKGTSTTGNTATQATEPSVFTGNQYDFKLENKDGKNVITQTDYFGRTVHHELDSGNNGIELRNSKSTIYIYERDGRLMRVINTNNAAPLQLRVLEENDPIYEQSDDKYNITQVIFPLEKKGKTNGAKQSAPQAGSNQESNSTTTNTSTSGNGSVKADNTTTAPQAAQPAQDTGSTTINNPTGNQGAEARTATTGNVGTSATMNNDVANVKQTTTQTTEVKPGDQKRSSNPQTNTNANTIDPKPNNGTPVQHKTSDDPTQGHKPLSKSATEAEKQEQQKKKPKDDAHGANTDKTRETKDQTTTIDSQQQSSGKQSDKTAEVSTTRKEYIEAKAVVDGLIKDFARNKEFNAGLKQYRDALNQGKPAEVKSAIEKLKEEIAKSKKLDKQDAFAKLDQCETKLISEESKLYENAAKEFANSLTGSAQVRSDRKSFTQKAKYQPDQLKAAKEELNKFIVKKLNDTMTEHGGRSETARAVRDAVMHGAEDAKNKLISDTLKALSFIELNDDKGKTMDKGFSTKYRGTKGGDTLLHSFCEGVWAAIKTFLRIEPEAFTKWSKSQTELVIKDEVNFKEFMKKANDTTEASVNNIPNLKQGEKSKLSAHAKASKDFDDALSKIVSNNKGMNI